MGIVRIQYQRPLLGAPAIGKWSVYSTAWFNATVEDPSSIVQTYIERLFQGRAPSGQGNPIIGNGAFSSAVGAANITTWSWFSGTLTKVSSYARTVESLNPGPAIQMPSQAQVAIGYKANVQGPVQRGRSRFFLGPCSTSSSYVVQNAAGGLRLTTGAVDTLTDNVKQTVNALAAQGWVLQVKSGQSLLASFSPAVEVYCDDVFDVMRSRRAWQLYQKRRTL